MGAMIEQICTLLRDDVVFCRAHKEAFCGFKLVEKMARISRKEMKEGKKEGLNGWPSVGISIRFAQC